MADEGIFDKASGKAKEVAGKVTSDKDLEAEGKVQKGVGDLKEGARDALKK